MVDKDQIKRFSFAGYLIGVGIFLTGCSDSKSNICAGSEVESEILATAKSDGLLYDKIFAETNPKPYANDGKWKELSEKVRISNSKFADLTSKSESLYKKCLSLEEKGFFAELAKSPMADKNNVSQAYSDICNGDFSKMDDTRGFSKEYVASFVAPRKYEFWKNNIVNVRNQISEEQLTLENLNNELGLFESNYFDNAYNNVIYSIGEIALENNNDSETNFSCSANVYAEVKGWKKIKGLVNYHVKITADDEKRIDIVKDDSYTRLIQIPQ